MKKTKLVSPANRIIDDINSKKLKKELLKTVKGSERVKLASNDLEPL